jgi:hypothetical protein
MKIVLRFFADRIDLSVINTANVVMIPKGPTLKAVEDYRPISIISIIPKLLSKILGNRLRTELADLVDIRQSAFVRGRHLSDNFLADPPPY